MATVNLLDASQSQLSPTGSSVYPTQSHPQAQSYNSMHIKQEIQIPQVNIQLEELSRMWSKLVCMCLSFRPQVSSLTSSPDSSPSPIAIALGQVSAANGGGSNGSSTNMSIGGMNGQIGRGGSSLSMAGNNDGTGMVGGGGGTGNGPAGGGGELPLSLTLVYCYARAFTTGRVGHSPDAPHQTLLANTQSLDQHTVQDLLHLFSELFRGNKRQGFVGLWNKRICFLPCCCVGSMPNQGSDSKMWYPNSTTASPHSQSPKTFNFDSNPTSTADSGSVVETLR